MKLYLFLLTTLFGGCFANHSVYFSWGDVSEIAGRITQTNIFIRTGSSLNPNEVHNRTYTYPENGRPNKWETTIDGIKILSLALIPPQVQILNGGIGRTSVTLSIVAPPQRPINCRIKLYLSQRAIDKVPRVVENYFGGEFQIDPSGRTNSVT